MEGVATLPPSKDARSRLYERVGATPLTQPARERFVRVIETHGLDWHSPIAQALLVAPTATVTPAPEPNRFTVTLERRDIDPDAEGGAVFVSQTVTIEPPLRGRTIGVDDVTCHCPWPKCTCAVLAVALLPQLQSM